MQVTPAMNAFLSRSCDPPRANSPSRVRVRAPTPVPIVQPRVVVTIDSVLEHLGELSGDAEADADHWAILQPNLDTFFAAAGNVRVFPTAENWATLLDEVATVELGWWGPGCFLDAIRIDDASDEADRENCLDVLHTLKEHFELIDDHIHEQAARAVEANEMDYA